MKVNSLSPLPISLFLLPLWVEDVISQLPDLVTMLSLAAIPPHHDGLFSLKLKAQANDSQIAFDCVLLAQKEKGTNNTFVTLLYELYSYKAQLYHSFSCVIM